MATDMNMQPTGFYLSPMAPYDPAISYGCLSTAANRGFEYSFFKACASGSVSISGMALVSSYDIDIVVWGPFSTNVNICSNLTAGNIAGCSAIPAVDDTVTLSSVNSGDVYMVCISADTALFSAIQPVGFRFGTATIDQTCALTANCLTNINPIEMICNITVDSTTQKYKIAWEEVPVNPVAYFEIYKYINSSQQVLIDTVHLNSLSEYIDMNSNPGVVAERYEIAVQDTCNLGGWRNLGSYAEAVFCQASISSSNTVNLTWTDYLINATPSADFFVILRGASPTTMVPIDTVADFIHNYNDLNPLSGISYYKIGVITSLTCVPSRLSSPVIQSYSNNSAVTVIGITEHQNQLGISVFPNPSDGKIRIAGIEELMQINIADMTGRIVYSQQISPVAFLDLDLSILEQGIYTIHFASDSGRSSETIVITK